MGKDKERIRGYFTTQRGKRKHVSARQHRYMHHKKLSHTHHMPTGKVSRHKFGIHNPHIYTVGFLGSMAIVLSLLIFMYYTTLQIESSILLSSVMLLVVGLLFAWVMVGVRFEPFELKRMFESILWTAMSAVAIWMVNRYVPFTLDVGFASTRLFSMLMGVAEESFFRLFLTTFMYKVTKMAWLAIVISSATWTIYHIGRYGGDMSAFFVIFMAGLVLGFVMLYSKMVDGVMFAHALVNYLATA